MNEDTTQIDTTVLTDEELSKLGLREHPFTEHADDAFLYSDSQLEMTSNIIMEYLTSPATTIVLSGEDGVGKTTFLRKVLRLGYQQYQFCTLRVRGDTDFDYIEQKIKQRWVLAETSEQSLVVDLSIENYVITYLREHTHAVLIINDAHFLDPATLDRLFTLKHRIGLACPLSLGFILAGENTLKLSIAALEDSNPACSQVYQINVRPLRREQASHYIDHRLLTAGLENDTLLDDAKITEIYKATSGNVRQINGSAISALQDQCRKSPLDNTLSPHITIRIPKLRTPVLLMILAIISIGFFINHHTNTNNGEVTIPLETPSLPLPITLAPTTKQPDISSLQSIEAKNQQGTILRDSLLTESIEHFEEKQQEAGHNEGATKVTSSREPTTQSNAAPEPTSTQTSVPLHGEEWLKTLDASSYTLQVVATSDIKRLESLIKEENIKVNYAYFYKPVKDATFYVLVIGNYKTRSDAVDAAAKLPANLRKNKPWPVPLTNIQKYLN